MASQNLIELGAWKGDQYAYDPSSKKILIKTQYGYEPPLGAFAQQQLKAHFADKVSDLDAAGSEFKQDNTIRLSPKTTTNSGSNTLRYPNEMIDGDTDYVTFGFYEYNPPFGKGEGQGGLTDFDAANAYNFYNASGIGREDNKFKAAGFKSIVLYMPEDIQSQYGARWGGAEFGTAAVGAMRTFGGELPSSDVAVDAAKGVLKTAFYQKTIDSINKFTGSNINVNQFMGGVSGTILNPNTELLYEGTEMRTFSLSFKMTPKSNIEASEIKRICNTFKKAMLPDIGGQTLFGKATSLLKIPKLCQVQFMSGPELHRYLPAYKLCAITGVDVNYTADGAYATYAGGSPVSTKLTVSFKETKILFSNDIRLDDISY